MKEESSVPLQEIGMKWKSIYSKNLQQTWEDKVKLHLNNKTKE
jgi:hypothetical protein